MEELLNMGFARDLAAQALAATGGKSTLKATEWILNQRVEVHNKAAATDAGAGSSNKMQQQVRVDRFFSTRTLDNAMGLHSMAEGECPPRPALRQRISFDGKGGGVVGGGMNDCSQQGTGLDGGKVCRDGVENIGLGSTFNECTDRFVDTEKLQPIGVPLSQELPAKRHRDEGEQENPAKTTAPPFTAVSPLEHCSKRERGAEQGRNYQRIALPAVPAAMPASGSRKNKEPLAERMRPTSIDEIVGQDHLLGPSSILRSLLENDSLPSVIFWGPPGTGKTSLAKVISRCVSYRFVSLSAVTSGVKEVRGVLEEAKRLKKMGQRTLLFVDEVHRFNKSQQDAFLPPVEAGHVVFIGATTENPSFEVNGALLSRCRVLTLSKLQPQDVEKLLERAVYDQERGVLASFPDDPLVQQVQVEDEALKFLAASADGDARVALNTLEIAVATAVTRERHRRKLPGFYEIKSRDENDKTANFLSKESPRPGMAGLAAKRDLPLRLVSPKECHPSQEEYARPFKSFVESKEASSHLSSKDREPFVRAEENEIQSGAGDSGRDMRGKSVTAVEIKDGCVHNRHADVPKSMQADGVILVSLLEIREALQRSHLSYDKTGEEHYNIISALHKSMRGGNPDAALYWLARMLEGGEGPLYVARRLIRFASEDVGLADPQALLQAVACYQSCHFLGMPECNVNLAQCVAYLSLAPKSVAVYRAIDAAQRMVRETGQNEPVPLHLRNAPTRLMKQLGYGKGYIYPPAHEGSVEQEYLPPSLRGYKFLDWP
eukprot:c28786_g1_i1 orf=33-2354(+)